MGRAGRRDSLQRQAGQGADSSPPHSALDRVPGWSVPLVYLLFTIFLFREFIFTDQMLFGEDTLSLGYMARAFFADALRAGTFPLWNPMILGGTPFLESLAGGDSLYPPSLLLLLLGETYRALGWKLVLHVFLAGCFMYGWLRMLDRSRGAALLGGLGFLLAPYMVTLVFPGHDGKLFVTALTPLLFWMAEWSLRRRGLLPLSALGLVVALIILTTHFQMAYFLFGAVGAYMVFRAVEEGRGTRGWAWAGRRFGLFLLFAVLGAGAAAVQLLPAYEYVTESSRRAATTLAADGQVGVEYSSSWSLHPEEAVSLVVPEFIGGNSRGAEWTTDTYWGRNVFKLNHEYLGLVLLLLAAVSFLGAPRRGVRWFLVGMGGVAFFFALGANTPVWRIFYEVVPGISLFRAPSMVIFLTGFAVTTLAAFGVDRGVELGGEGEGMRVVRLLGWITGIVALLWLLAASGALLSLWTSVLYSDLSEEAAESLALATPHIVRGFFLALLLAAATAAAWWGHARSFVPAAGLVALLGGLIAVDQARVNTPFLQSFDYHQWSRPDANHRFLQSVAAGAEEPFRVASLILRGQDVTAGMHGIEMATGHHPNDVGRYRELIGMVGSGIPEHIATFNPNVLRLLNVRYIVWPVAQFGPIQGVEPVSQVTLADGRVLSAVYAYPGLPRARVVGEVVVVPEPEAVERILDPDRFDPGFQAILSEPPPIQLAGAGVEWGVRWLDRSFHEHRLEVESTGPALLVIADNWVPGWRARVNGEEAEVLRADHTFRGIPIPGGRSEVEIWYEGTLLRAGLTLSLFSLLILVSCGATSLLLERRRRADDPPSD